MKALLGMNSRNLFLFLMKLLGRQLWTDTGKFSKYSFEDWEDNIKVAYKDPGHDVMVIKSMEVNFFGWW
jgi:hypothetical protein